MNDIADVLISRLDGVSVSKSTSKIGKTATELALDIMLAIRRTNQNFTQRDIALFCGISRSSIVAIEETAKHKIYKMVKIRYGIIGKSLPKNYHP